MPVIGRRLEPEINELRIKEGIPELEDNTLPSNGGSLKPEINELPIKRERIRELAANALSRNRPPSRPRC